MTLRLDDFNEGQLSVEDFEAQTPKGTGVNNKTASQLAASQTLLTTSDPQEYSRLKSDLRDPETKGRFVEEQKSLRRQAMMDAKESLPAALADPSLSDEEKLQMISGAEAEELSDSTSSLVLMAEQAITSSAPRETIRSGESRNLLLESVDRVQRHSRKVQAHINGLGLEQGTLGTVVDVAELMQPYLEWIHFSNLQADLAPEESRFKLLGTVKQELFDVAKGRPLEERAQMVEGIFNILKDNENVLLPDGNDLLTLETLEQMFLQNDYSDFERYFDNFTSLLDIAGLGGVLRSLGKSSKAVKAIGESRKEIETVGRSLEEEAADFVSSPDVPDNALAREAEDFQAPSDPTEGSVFGSKSERARKRAKKRQELKDETIRRDIGADKFKPEPEPDVDTVFREALTTAVRTEVAPTSPSQVVKDYNPDSARGMHKMVVDDETGETAQALYGSSRTEAIANDLLPEPKIKQGRMKNKVDIRPDTNEPEAIRRRRSRNGNTIISEAEEASIQKKLTEGLQDVQGMYYHKNSLQVSDLPDGGTRYRARYSPVDSGFRKPQEALDAAEIAFRTYRMPPESFKLLARFGDEWVEVSKADIDADAALRQAGAEMGEPPVDYAVAIDFDYKFGADDLDLVEKELELLTTSNGWISSFLQKSTQWAGESALTKVKQGTIYQHLLDAASTIHPQIVNAASVAVDRTFGLKNLYLKEFEKFADLYNKLSKDRRAIMTDYIHKANLEGLALDESTLYSNGFTAEEIEALKEWRRANDIMWYAANDDMGKSLRSKGVKVYIHKGSDTRLMGRPLKQGAVTSRSVYDPELGRIVQLDANALEQVYEKRGEVFRTMEAFEVDGQWTDQVVSTNKAGQSFTREIYEGETVLSYRDGYYPVMYDANYFIEKIVRGVDGKIFKKVVASAKDSKSVEEFKASIRQSENLTEAEYDELYSSRLDRRLEQSGNSLFEEGQWNVAASAGLTSQRLRGQRLADAGEGLHKRGKEQLKDPLEAVTTQIHQMSQRVSMRDYMESAKKRWVLTYGKYLDLPVNPKTGQVEIPADISQLAEKNGAPEKLVRDARTTFHYLRSLEDGYINGIDEAYRGMLHKAAQFMGEIGFSAAERAAFEVARVNPSQVAKTLAFKFFISANPLRQAVIQRSQIFMLAIHNPKYALGPLQRDWWGVTKARYGDKASPEHQKLWEELQKSGVIEAVAAHTLIRDDMISLSNHTMWQRAGKLVNYPFEKMQLYGFDRAEQDVLITAWLSARDAALKAGKDLSKQRVKDEILGEARSFTLNMNRAGEMPYSQNTLGVIAQFFSFRHKALLQTLSNRNLTPVQRAQMLAYTTIVFGIDSTIFYGVVNAIFGEEPSEEKDLAREGLLSATFNTALTLASGEDQMIDWGDMAPTEAYGIGNLFTAGLSLSFPAMLANSPSGSLMLGANPRLNDAMASAYKFFVPGQNYEDPNLRVNFADVAHTFMSTSSGYSNAFKAAYALRMDQKMSGSGRVTDADITKVEAVATLFGFRTLDEEGRRKVNEIRFADSIYSPDDVEHWYGELKRHLTRRWESVTDAEMSVSVLQEAWRVFGDDRDRVQEQILTLIQRDASAGDHRMIMGIINEMGLMTEDDIWKMINALPDGSARDRLTQVHNARKESLDGS